MTLAKTALAKTTLATLGAAAVLLGAAVGVGSAPASADPPPPSLPAPPSAPRKPAESWQGKPMVWWNLPSGGHWGVWYNGQFLPFT